MRDKIPEVKKGERVLAESQNRLIAQANKLAHLTDSPHFVDLGDKIVFRPDGHEEPFWLEITGPMAEGGGYPWKQVEPIADGQWEPIEYGWTSDGLENPAYEVNGRADIAAGTRGRAWLGYANAAAPESKKEGVVGQEYLFTVGAGGGGGFWARIDGSDCAAGSFTITEMVPATGGTMTPREGGITSSLAYHANKQNFPSGGPRVATGTIVWARAGFSSGETQEYVFDSPAGLTGRLEIMTDWTCNPSTGQGEKTTKYFDFWNGQITRSPCINPPPASVCDPCSPS